VCLYEVTVVFIIDILDKVITFRRYTIKEKGIVAKDTNISLIDRSQCSLWQYLHPLSLHTDAVKPIIF
jgi:hypothetical protein